MNTIKKDMTKQVYLHYNQPQQILESDSEYKKHQGQEQYLVILQEIHIYYQQ